MFKRLIDRIVAKILNVANESFTRQTNYPLIEMIEQYEKFGVVAPHILEKAEDVLGMRSPVVRMVLERAGALELHGALLIKDVVTMAEYHKLQETLGVVRKDLEREKAICEEQLKVISRLIPQKMESEKK